MTLSFYNLVLRCTKYTACFYNFRVQLYLFRLPFYTPVCKAEIPTVYYYTVCALYKTNFLSVFRLPGNGLVEEAETQQSCD
jgi:hypothetical protein